MSQLFTYIKDTYATKHKLLDCDKKISEQIDGYKSINENTQLKDIYDGRTSDIYTPKFLSYINRSDTEILKNKNENLKYVNIGKIFKNFKCNNNDFRNRLETHIININKIRVWNKKILLLKLKTLIIQSIKKIGGCDDSFLDRYKVKNVGQKMKKSLNTFLFQDQIDSEDKEDELKVSIVNKSRTLINAFIQLYKASTISSKEYTYIEKIDPKHWLTNPLIIGSFTSVMTAISNNAYKHTSEHQMKEIEGIEKKIDINGLKLISAVSTVITPFLSIGLVWMLTNIQESKTYKQLTLNKKILEEFDELKKPFVKKFNIQQEDCLHDNISDYKSRFQTVQVMIDEFQEECEKNYNEILDLCYDYINVYDIICAEPIEQPPDAMSPVAKSPVAKSHVAKSPDAKSPDAKSHHPEHELDTNALIEKIKNCEYPNEHINKFNNLLDEEKTNKIQKISKEKYNKIMNTPCKDSGKLGKLVSVLLEGQDEGKGKGKGKKMNKTKKCKLKNKKHLSSCRTNKDKL